MKKEEHESKANSLIYFFVQYFGFWALAYALALRFTKLTIEFRGWVSTE